MEETCSCGTRLVEGARFCHRCGKPTYEPDPGEARSPETTVAGPDPEGARRDASVPSKPPSYNLPIGFNNPVALRVAMLLAPIVLLLSAFPFLNILAWFGGGWFAVVFYRRITGAKLTASHGARLGGLIGLMTFLGITAITAISLAFSGKSMFEDAVVQYPQIRPMLNDTSVLVAIALFSLVISFGIIVGASAGGGALSAKLSPKSKTAV